MGNKQTIRPVFPPAFLERRLLELAQYIWYRCGPNVKFQRLMDRSRFKSTNITSHAVFKARIPGTPTYLYLRAYFPLTVSPLGKPVGPAQVPTWRLLGRHFNDRQCDEGHCLPPAPDSPPPCLYATNFAFSPPSLSRSAEKTKTSLCGQE